MGSGIDLSSIELKSNKSSKKSSKKSSVKPVETGKVLGSDEISISQLELMANHKKMMKQNEVQISEMLSKKETLKPSKPTKPRTATTISSISSSSEPEAKRKRKEKQILKENKDGVLRKEKSELLYKFNKMNVKQKWSSLRLDMNNSTLDEIQNECERVRCAIQSERSIAFYKRMMLLGVQGIEMMNNKFDPMGVDLDGWSEAMGYSLENQDYDEVMAELVEKYKGAGQMSPEVKLIFMIISSATMFTVSKKISKMDDSNIFTNLMGSLGGQAPAQQQYQPPQQQYQQQYQPPPRQYTETTEDVTPSKMQGPNIASEALANNELHNILQTMNARKAEKAKEQSEESDEVFKSISLPTKRGRGRPKKAKITKV